VTAVPVASSTQYRRVITEPFHDARAPLTNLFLMVVVKTVPSGPSMFWWEGLKWKYGLTFQSPLDFFEILPLY
jgi:hypothetical protein